MISANSKAELAAIEGRQNAQKYVDVLETSLLPFTEAHPSYKKECSSSDKTAQGETHEIGERKVIVDVG